VHPPPQRPILTVTLNPAVDFAGRVARVEPGPKLRLGEPRTDPGGGGINAARAIRRLGGAATAFVALGGAMGAQLAWLMQAEGVPLVRFDGPGETRHSLSVVETGTGAEYRFVLPGSDWTAAQAASVLEAVAATADGRAVVLLSGSQPPGVPDDFPTRLARRLGPDALLMVDTSGTPLDRLVDLPDPDAAPAVLRMDDAEAEDVAGRPLPLPADTAGFAAALVARGAARRVVIARGAEGSVLVGPEGRLHCIPPRVEVASKVGAGDSFSGAFALAMARGEDAAAALRAGTAAAAAAVMTPGTDLCRAEDAARLAPLCRLVTL
jgi:6-phosphofructokinase 2